MPSPQYKLSPEIKEVFVQFLAKLAIDPKFANYQKISLFDPNRFSFLISSKAAPSRKGRVNVAKIRRVSEPVSHLTPVRYIVVVFSNWSALSPLKKDLVLLHELRHVDAEHELKGAEDDKKLSGKLVDHDLIDFKDMVRDFGVDWFSEPELPPSLPTDQKPAAVPAAPEQPTSKVLVS